MLLSNTTWLRYAHMHFPSSPGEVRETIIHACVIRPAYTHDHLPLSLCPDTMAQLGKDEFRGLGRDDCADVVCLVARLGVLPHESWLDLLAVRTYELGLGRMSHTQVARLAWGLSMFQYEPPSEWAEVRFPNTRYNQKSTFCCILAHHMTTHVTHTAHDSGLWKGSKFTTERMQHSY